MRFGCDGSPSLSFFEASSRGYPHPAECFRPDPAIDLGSLVYAPELSFRDTAALALAALFPEELDPQGAFSVAGGIFLDEPRLFPFGEDLLFVDLASGPSANYWDYVAACGVGLLAPRALAEGRVLLAALGDPESSALAMALKRYPALRAILLVPEKGLGAFPEDCLRRNGGQTILVGVRGGERSARKLEGELCGERLPGLSLFHNGHGTPPSFAGQLLLLILLFSMARRGLAGDLLLTLPSGAADMLAAGLWAWHWGLPVSAFIQASARSMRTEDRSPPRPLGPSLESLIIRPELDTEELLVAQETLLGSGIPSFDEGTALCFAAARRALAAGFCGHGRILVPRLASSSWDGSPKEREGGREPDLLIDPSPGAFGLALKKLFPGGPSG